MFDFLLIASGVVFGLVVLLAITNADRPNVAEQLAERERRHARFKVILAQKDDWLEGVRGRFQFVTAGKLIDGPGEGNCVFAFDQASQSLRVFGYTTGGEFRVRVDANIPLNQISSLEVVRPMEMKKVKRTQAVGIVKTNKKSPVARGLVGGAVLGPAGVVLGAASGASKDINTEIKEHTVWEQVQMEGDPQLHIGTTDPESPLIRIKPETAALAEEWLHRIRALQSHGAGGAKSV